MLTNQRVCVEWETHLLIMPGMHKQAAGEKWGVWSGRSSSYRGDSPPPPAQEIKNQNAMTVSVSKYCREVGQVEGS